MKSARLYLIQAAIVLGILAVGFDLPHLRMSVPVVGEGDALDFVAIARSLLDGDSIWSVHRLSSPPGLPLVMFPLCGVFEYAWLALFSLVAKTPGAVVNEAYFASFVLTGLTACWCLRRLAFGPAMACALATLYAFLPWAFYRNIVHFSLVYYLVPFAATSSVLLWSDQIRSLSRRDRAVLCAGTCLVGFSYIYTAFFSCFLLGVAGLGHLARTRRLDGLKWSVRRIAAISVLAAVSLVPAAIAWHRDPVGHLNVIGQKQLFESDMLGLKLRHLLTPRLDHPLPFFAAFAARTDHKFPLENENAWAQLGLAGSVGFLFLLWVVCFRLGRRTPGGLEPRIEAAAGLNLAAFLFGTIGGFGSIFSSVITVQIRNYNRISIFIAFYALIGVGYLLSAAVRRRGQLVSAGLCAAIAGLGVWDQAAFAALHRRYLTSADRSDEVRGLVDRIEASAPKGGVILQIPFADYPFTSQTIYHAHFLPYACSRTLRWSWPALDSGSIDYQRRLAAFSPPTLARCLPLIGYAGVWVDRSGYPDRAVKLIAELDAALGTRHLDSSEGNYAFVTVPPAAEPLRTLIAQSHGQAPDLGRLVNIQVGATADFATPGQNEQFLQSGWTSGDDGPRGTLGPRAVLRFVFPQIPTADLSVEATGFAFVPAQHPHLEVRVFANGLPVGLWTFDRNRPPQPFSFRVSPARFHGQSALVLAFEIHDPISPKALDLSSDERQLGLALQKIRFQ